MNNAPRRLNARDAGMPSTDQAIRSERNGRGALALAIASALGLWGAGAAQAGSSTIVAGGGTHDLGTVVDNANAGDVYDVRTGEAGRRNGNAFNSFSEFKLQQGDTVNLHLDGAKNLINLVWDSEALINGTLNSYFKDNEIGGRVFFVDPHGVVVGANGQLNVGSLAIATPSTQFMSSLVGDLDGAAGGPLESLLTGTLRQDQLSAAGVTIKQGARINALNDVRVQARAIDVSGTIFVEAPAAGRNGDFNLDTVIAVNTGSTTVPTLVNDGGSIRLLAVDSVTVGAGGRAQADGDIQLSAVSRTSAQAGFAEANALVSVDGTLGGRTQGL